MARGICTNCTHRIDRDDYHSSCAKGCPESSAVSKCPFFELEE